MFPSLGYFHSYLCPDEDESCSRIYCHFNHLQKLKSNVNKDASQSSTNALHRETEEDHSLHTEEGANEFLSADEELQRACKKDEGRNDKEADEAHVEKEAGEDEKVGEGEPNSPAVKNRVNSTDEASLLQQLLSEAVKKVLTESPILSSSLDASALIKKMDAEALVSRAIDQVSNPNSSLPQQSRYKRPRLYLPPPGTPSYNPTPISKLKNKRPSFNEYLEDNGDEYIPTPLASNSAVTSLPCQEDSNSAVFSPIDESEDSDKLDSEFDLLEEVMAEHSTDPNRTKAIKRRKKAYAKLNPTVTKRVKPPVSNKGDKNKSSLEGKATNTDSHIEAPAKRAKLDKSSSTSNKEICEGSSKKKLLPNSAAKNEIRRKNSVEQPKDPLESQKLPSDSKEDKNKPEKDVVPTHSLLPKIFQLTRPNTKEWIPMAKPLQAKTSSYVNVEKMLERLDGDVEDSGSVCQHSPHKDRTSKVKANLHENPVDIAIPKTPKKELSPPSVDNDDDDYEEKDGSSSTFSHQSEKSSDLEHSHTKKSKSKRQKRGYSSSSSHGKWRKKKRKRERKGHLKRRKKKKYSYSEDSSDSELSCSEEDRKTRRKSKERKSKRRKHRSRSHSHSHRKKNKRKQKKKSKPYGSSSSSSSDRHESSSKRERQRGSASKKKESSQCVHMPIAADEIKQERIEIDLTIVKDEDEEEQPIVKIEGKVKNESTASATSTKDIGSSLPPIFKKEDGKSSKSFDSKKPPLTRKLSHEMPPSSSEQNILPTNKDVTMVPKKIQKSPRKSIDSVKSVTVPTPPVNSDSSKTLLQNDKNNEKKPISDSSSSNSSKARLLREVSLFGSDNYPTARRKSSDKPSKKESVHDKKDSVSRSKSESLRKRTSSSSSSSSSRRHRSSTSIDDPCSEKPARSSESIISSKEKAKLYEGSSMVNQKLAEGSSKENQFSEGTSMVNHKLSEGSSMVNQKLSEGSSMVDQFSEGPSMVNQKLSEGSSMVNQKLSEGSSMVNQKLSGDSSMLNKKLSEGSSMVNEKLSESSAVKEKDPVKPKSKDMDKKHHRSSEKHDSSRRSSSSSSSHKKSLKSKSSKSHHKSDPNESKEKRKTCHKSSSHKRSSHHKSRDSRSEKKEVSINKDSKEIAESKGHHISSGSCSPIPDLSALDDIPTDAWNELMCNTVNIEPSAATEDSDDGIDPEPSSTSPNLEPTLEDELPSDTDDGNDPQVMEECLKMFSEFQPESEPVLATRKSGPKRNLDEEDESLESVQKHKRVAHGGASGNLVAKPKLSSQPKKKTPGEIMLERYKKLKEEEAALQKKLEQQRKEWEKYVKEAPSTSPCISSSSVSSTSGHDSLVMQSPASSSTIGARKRVARLPLTNTVHKGLLTNNKMKYFRTSPGASSSTTRHNPSEETPSMTNPKGVTRVAHNPKIETLSRPIISSDGNNKVPQNIRQRYLNCFIDETLKFCDGQEHAFKVALAEEKACHNRASTRMVYLNVAVHTLKRLRSKTISEDAQDLLSKEAQDESCEEPSSSLSSPSHPSLKKFAHPLNPNHKVTSHFSVLAVGGQKGSWSIQKSKKTLPSNIDQLLTGPRLRKFLKKYILSSEMLDGNGFPRLDSLEKGKAVIKKLNSRKKVSPSETERYCARCHVLYSVDELGVPLLLAPCIYHWGRPYKTRSFGGLETKYSCCHSDNSSDGCCQGTTHVSENFSLDSLRGFVKTIHKESDTEDGYGVYALDCEMCYTTNGNELTRVTVIGTDNQTVYEAMVKPDNPIIDYNTRFSGITAEDLEGVTVCIRDVQAALLTRFSDKTILMGHSLESDFAALKIVHCTVVDTSIVFPHRLGPPYKRALRNLASEFLNKIIQNDVSGHDSAEDAITCMELMKWKVKEDIKILKITPSQQK